MASSAKEARQIAEAVYTQLRTGTPDSIAHNSTAISEAWQEMKPCTAAQCHWRAFSRLWQVPT